MSRVMRRVMVCLPLALALVSLGGCAFLYELFGVNQDGTVQPGGGVVGTVAGVLNYWVPGVVGLTGAVTTVLAAIRGKQWKKAFVASADVLEHGAAVGKSAVEMKKEMAVAHAAKGVTGIVEKALDKFVRE